MVRALLVVAVLAGTARADTLLAADVPEAPRTYLANDEAFGEIISHGRWSYWAAGLGVTHRLVGHLEVGVEGSVMRLDSPDDDNPAHGFALRAAGMVGYRFTVSRLAGLDFGVQPEIGAGTALVTTTDTTSQHEVFAGVRGSFRAVFDEGRATHFGAARALGVHVTLRVAEAEHHLAASFLLGYDWGL